MENLVECSISPKNNRVLGIHTILGAPGSEQVALLEIWWQDETTCLIIISVHQTLNWRPYHGASREEHAGKQDSKYRCKEAFLSSCRPTGRQ
jgi:hypothetical protein